MFLMGTKIDVDYCYKIQAFLYCSPHLTVRFLELAMQKFKCMLKDILKEIELSIYGTLRTLNQLFLLLCQV